MADPTFRDAIRDVVADWEEHDDYPHVCADMVLAMPEMDTLRSFIWRETEPQTWMTLAEKREKHMDALLCWFTPAVAAWVLDGDA